MTTTTGMPRPRVAGATEALDDYLAHRGAAPNRPPLRYLRNKPGRGLVAVFGPGDGGDIYTVTLDQRSDAALPADGARPTIQQFPVDPKLPHLDVVMSPATQPALAAAPAAPGASPAAPAAAREHRAPSTDEEARFEIGVGPDLLEIDLADDVDEVTETANDAES